MGRPTTRIAPQDLWNLRNRVPIDHVLVDVVDLPVKHSEGHLRFLCPRCREFNTTANSQTNLAHCFRCKRNFNPIDLVMEVDGCTFLQAVERLSPLLDG